jgi:hypothetical protein
MSADIEMLAEILVFVAKPASGKGRLKADIQYDVNLKAELEVAYLHQKVDRIYEAMQAKFSKLDRKDRDWGKANIDKLRACVCFTLVIIRRITRSGDLSPWNPGRTGTRA